MYELTISMDFEAAHRLPNYPGKCQRLHGHNWKVETTVTGNKLNQLGMLIDFCDLKKELNNVISTLDHYYLNEIEAFKTMTPTAENIAKYIYDNFAKSEIFNNDLSLSFIKVWESSHSVVTYKGGK
jgi:6-pyruvoyltetrahydropterin/6-carboxytetrahydropterin synthase